MAHLNYNPLSLMDLAIRRVAAGVFKESTILASISNFHSKYTLFGRLYEVDWRETIEDKLPDEISKLGLPQSLTKLLNDTVKPMGQQIGRWKIFHEAYLKDSHGENIHFDEPILEKVSWTAAGAVDYRKTAEEIVLSDAIDVVKRYKLSCLYCMEDCIPIYWRELAEENQKYFFSKAGSRLQSGGLCLEFWWPYIIKGQESYLDDLTRSNRRGQITFYQYAFQCSAEKLNKTAAEYFFQKLSQEEKEASLMIATRALKKGQYTTQNYWDIQFPYEKMSEVLSYLLSIMTPEQQIRICQEEPYEVLECFLYWPFQDIFLEIAVFIWDIIPEEDRDAVLYVMYRNFEDSGAYCQILFQEFFLRIPPDFWIRFVDRQSEFKSYFDIMLIRKDIKRLEIFFRNVDASARPRLLFSERAFEHFHNCLSIGEWDVVEVCLREASLSQEDRERLKEAFLGYLTLNGVGETKLKTRKWARFFHLLNETYDPSKRCPEDEKPTEAKKRKT